MERADRFLFVFVTAPPDAAGDLARSLVETGLAACVNRIGPVRSTYRWRGTVETEEEVLLLIKTDAGHLESLEAHVTENHPYEVPEILALPVRFGTPAYLAWLAECLDGNGP